LACSAAKIAAKLTGAKMKLRAKAIIAGKLPFRKGDKVILMAKKLLGQVIQTIPAYSIFVVRFTSGQEAEVYSDQASQLRKYSGPMITKGQNAELAELLNNGSDPEDIARILGLSLDVVAQFMD
jgi:hypothetical protein